MRELGQCMHYISPVWRTKVMRWRSNQEYLQFSKIDPTQQLLAEAPSKWLSSWTPGFWRNFKWPLILPYSLVSNKAFKLGDLYGFTGSIIHLMFQRESRATFTTGWLFQPLWRIMEFVSWDDDIPHIMGKINFMFQTTNQTRSFISDIETWILPGSAGDPKNPAANASERPVPPQEICVLWLVYNSNNYGLRYLHHYNYS